MAIYSLGAQSTVTGPAAGCDWVVAATAYAKVMEYGINNAAGTLINHGLGRSTNTPTQTGTVTALAEDAGNTVASKMTWAATWTTAPTITTYARRCYLPATAGTGMVFTFPRGYSLLAANSFVHYVIATGSAAWNVWAVFDE